MNKSIYAKVGTIPMNIILKNATNVKVGDYVKFKECEEGNGAKWQGGVIDALEPVIFIERM